MDGAPNGYSLYEIEGDHMKNWVAKSTGLPADYQMRVYNGNQTYTGVEGYIYNWYKDSVGEKITYKKFIYISNTRFEVSEDFYKEYYREKEHSRYLHREEQKVTIVSYENLGVDLSAEDIIMDTDVNVEETVINKIMLERLNEILGTLNEEELYLLDKLIYNEESRREVGRRLSISHTAVSKRLGKLIKKLRYLMDN